MREISSGSALMADLPHNRQPLGCTRSLTALVGPSASQHNQRSRSVSDILGPAGGAARVEIEVHAVLAQPPDLGARVRVSHPMDHTQRGVAKMADAGFDPV